MEKEIQLQVWISCFQINLVKKKYSNTKYTKE